MAQLLFCVFWRGNCFSYLIYNIATLFFCSWVFDTSTFDPRVYQNYIWKLSPLSSLLYSCSKKLVIQYFSLIQWSSFFMSKIKSMDMISLDIYSCALPISIKYIHVVVKNSPFNFFCVFVFYFNNFWSLTKLLVNLNSQYYNKHDKCKDIRLKQRITGLFYYFTGCIIKEL